VVEDFIGVYENAFSKEYCYETIKFYNFMDELGFTYDRQKIENIPKTLKNDNVFVIQEAYNINFDVIPSKLIISFNEKFWDFYRDYVSNFDILNEMGPHGNNNVKIQKTKIGGGYHKWHTENDNKLSSNRLMVWSLFLNDVEEGGETEFLYYPKRIKAKAGTLIIWPASFTHTHRGNPPISNEKYIMTGWLTF